MKALIVVALLVAIAVGGIFGAQQLGFVPAMQSQLGGAVTSENAGGSVVSLNTQNPSVSFAFVNALTKQSVTVSATNWKDSATNGLLGSGPSFEAGQVAIPMVNASGYITEVMPAYTVKAGTQSVKGEVYQQANATIRIYDDAGTGTIGGTLGSTGNDTKTTTQLNNKIVLTGNAYKSTGKMFAIFEVSTTSNVSSVTLSKDGSALSSVAVPNCYSNTLTGTPFRIAWELPAIVGASQATYNLQTVALNGNTVQGQALFTIYNEQAGVDSLNGEFLTSGICDSNNVAFHKGLQANTYYYNE